MESLFFWNSPVLLSCPRYATIFWRRCCYFSHVSPLLYICGNNTLLKIKRNKKILFSTLNTRTNSDNKWERDKGSEYACEKQLNKKYIWTNINTSIMQRIREIQSVVTKEIDKVHERRKKTCIFLHPFHLFLLHIHLTWTPGKYREMENRIQEK